MFKTTLTEAQTTNKTCWFLRPTW